MSLTNPAIYWNADRILAHIILFHGTHGRWPVTQDFDSPSHDLPSTTTVRRLFRTLADARRQAGAADGGHEGRGSAGRGGARTWRSHG